MYHKVMLALDGNEFGAAAMEHLRDLASAAESEVVLVSVTPKHCGWFPSPFNVDAMRQVDQRKAQQQLQRARDYLTASGVYHLEVASVESDSPGSAIVDAAHRFGCDAIVVESQNRSRFVSLIGQSVGQYVARHLKDIDVLLVHIDESA